MADYSMLYWEIKARLKGGWLDTNERGNWVIKYPKLATPFLDDEGVEHTMFFFNGLITKIQAITNYEDEDVRKWDEEVDWELCKFFYAQIEKGKYGLTIEKANVIIRIIMSAYDANMRKSIGGASMQMMAQQERIVETKTTQAPNRKIFGMF